MQRKSSARQKAGEVARAAQPTPRGAEPRAPQALARALDPGRSAAQAPGSAAETQRAAAQSAARPIDVGRAASSASTAGARAAQEPKAAPPASQRGSGELSLGGHVDRGLTLAALYDTGLLERLRLEVRIRLIADLTQSLGWLHANPRLMAAHPHLLIAPSTVVIGLDGVARVDVRAAKKQTSERNPFELDYVAPEVLDGNPNADRRADIFSLGVLAWEALAGRRIGAEPAGLAYAADLTGVPPALGGVPERDPLRRHVPERGASPPPAPGHRALVPPLALPEEAEWARPFAELVLLAMRADPRERPRECLLLSTEIERVSARLASPQEIAEAVQGITGIDTLCVPEPTLPDADAVCQSDGERFGFMDREPCSPLERCCAQRPAPIVRPVQEPATAAGAALAVDAPTLAARPVRAMSAPQTRAGSARPAWFAAGLAWIAILGLLAGFAASLLALR